MAQQQAVAAKLPAVATAAVPAAVPPAVPAAATPTAAAALNDPLTTDLLSSTYTAPAVCRINIRGTPSGTISAASMVCSGGTASVMVAADKLLSGFRPGIKSVVWDEECGLPGCFLTFCGSTRVVVAESSISGIQGKHIDAVVCAADTVVLTLQSSNVTHNNATALAAFNQSRVVIAASRLAHNVGYIYNGGAFVGDDATLDIRDHSLVVGNVATNSSGAGVRVGGYARGTITGKSQVVNNTSGGWVGGGVVVVDDGRLVVDGGSCICNNTSGAGGLFADDRAHVTVMGASSVSFNSGVNGSGGGGVVVSGNASLTITGGSSVFNNTCRGFSGGGVVAARNARLTITGGSSLCSNWAELTGGALLAMGNSTTSIINATICNNSCNSYTFSGGAGFVVVNTASVYISSAQVAGNWVDGWGSGGAMLVGQNGNLTLGPGVVLANNSVGIGVVGSNIASYSTSSLAIDPDVSADGRQLTKCDRSVYLGRMPCVEGEYQGSGICQCCPEYQYGFEANALTCRPCPQNAYCPGGTVVSPKPGFYHSAERSVQMHACPIASSCLGNDTCAPGYKGNLCGACAKGWGQTLALRCGKCMLPAQQFGVYVTIVFVTVVLITVTVHFTWQDNKAGDTAVRPSDLCKVLAQFLQYLVILGSMSVRWPSGP